VVVSLRLSNRRKLKDVAARYFQPEDLPVTAIRVTTLRLGSAKFGLSPSGNDLVVLRAPNDPWLQDHIRDLDEEQRVWAVVAFLKVRTISSPGEVIDRARSGDLYDENYFTKRGGGGPYVGYPAEASGNDSARGRTAIADELLALKPGRVLDLGAATGVLVKEFEDRGIDAAGVDISDWAIENRVTDSVVKGNALELPFEDQSFDTAISQDFMEHVHPDDLPKVLAEQVRVTKPGGRLFHLIPYYDSDVPYQLDAHLCQANREWWLKLFEQTPGIRVGRPDKGTDAPKVLDRHVELIRE
jgi:SAM-dependent methyltransferase